MSNQGNQGPTISYALHLFLLSSLFSISIIQKEGISSKERILSKGSKKEVKCLNDKEGLRRMEEPVPGIFKIEVPLPGNPLKAVNSYLVKGEDRDLLIDVGMNRDACRRALFPALERLGVHLERLDLFITHLHADHLGLSADFLPYGATIYFNKLEGELVRGDSFWEILYRAARENGFPLKELKKAIREHPGYRYGSRGELSFTYREEGDGIQVGEHTLLCLSTPGHSPGHLCLYDKKKKILFSGDHILERITPNISGWAQENPLKDYIDSLTKMEAYEVDLILPGHRQVFYDLRARIQKLKDHHHRRNEEVLQVLEGKEQTPYQVASRMSWDLSYRSWSQFPIPQQWFATGEALSHLNYLQEKGWVTSREEEGIYLYSRLS